MASKSFHFCKRLFLEREPQPNIFRCNRSHEIFLSSGRWRCWTWCWCHGGTSTAVKIFLCTKQNRTKVYSFYSFKGCGGFPSCAHLDNCIAYNISTYISDHILHLLEDSQRWFRELMVVAIGLAPLPSAEHCTAVRNLTMLKAFKDCWGQQRQFWNYFHFSVQQICCFEWYKKTSFQVGLTERLLFTCLWSIIKIHQCLHTSSCPWQWKEYFWLFFQNNLHFPTR